MKKFEDGEINTMTLTVTSGVDLDKVLQQLMQNQNEIIDWIAQTHPTTFRIHQVRSEHGE